MSLLPIVTIGLTESCVPLAERIAGSRVVTHFPDLEAAMWQLGDTYAASVGEPNGVVEPVAVLGEDGETWHCHVIYGEGAFGPVITAKRAVLLPHSGVTFALVDTFGLDQGRPRRVREGYVDDLEDPPSVYSAIGKLSVTAYSAADEVNGRGLSALSVLLSRAETDLAAQAATSA
jgi:hypothetical protein